MRASTLKAIAVSAFATMAVTSAASAADLAARPYTKAPVMVEVWNWTGFYIGGNAGYSWGRSNTDVSYLNSVTGAPIVPPAGSITGAGFDMNGGIAGGQIGYNWQSSNWVFGLEADAQWSGESGSAVYRCAATAIGGVCLPGLTFLPAGVTGTSLAVDQQPRMVRHRARPRRHPRDAAGIALRHRRSGLRLDQDHGAFAGVTPERRCGRLAGSSSDTRLGWTVGAGIEGKITSNWSAKLEYLYMDLDSFRARKLLAPAGQRDRRAMSTRVSRDHILRAGINYTFGGPVVAKY